MPVLKITAAAMAMWMLVACQRPPVPAQDKPPEPKALTRSVQAPLEKARGVQQTVDDAEKERRAQEERAEQ